MKNLKTVKSTHILASSLPRGRPRSAKVRQAILKATKEILEEKGISAVTIEGIAVRAGVGKPTIYRSWPNANAVAMTAMLETISNVPEEKTSSGLHELRLQLHHMVTVFTSRMGRNITTILAASDSNTELSKVFRNHFISEQRECGRRLLKKAIDEDDINFNTNIEVALDMIYGPIFYRLLVGHKPIDTKFTDAVLNHVIKGIGIKK